MTPSRLALLLTGAAATALIGLASELAHGPALAARLEARAATALRTAGGGNVTARFRTARFRTARGWLTRHPVLDGGAALDDDTRARAAQAVAALPGIGGVQWAARPSGANAVAPIHCQQDVEAIVGARSIRFAEARAELDLASATVLDEVAAALRPCCGGVIAITGHTDAAGDERANVALSYARTLAVRAALIGRGIPARGLRTRGYGSARPMAGLGPADAANRRIEFAVLATVPLEPTPVDTPGAD